VRALSIRPVEFPLTERRAEPILIAKLINGAVGVFNRMLFNLFFHHDKGSHQRLDGTRFLALVEHVDDLVAGKEERARSGRALPVRSLTSTTTGGYSSTPGPIRRISRCSSEPRICST
jgi:hypothetical protein